MERMSARSSGRPRPGTILQSRARLSCRFRNVIVETEKGVLLLAATASPLCKAECGIKEARVRPRIRADFEG